MPKLKNSCDILSNFQTMCLVEKSLKSLIFDDKFLILSDFEHHKYTFVKLARKKFYLRIFNRGAGMISRLMCNAVCLVEGDK